MNSGQIPGAKMIGGVFGAGAPNSQGVNNGTIVDSTPFTITQTWNDGAEIFKAFVIDITDTASASASLLVDLRVGGASQFNISKGGRLITNGDIQTVGNFNLLNNAGALVWGTDLSLTRDAAGVLAQRNGTNAQAFRIYNTISGADSEYGGLGWSANNLEIGTNKTGAGVYRDISFISSGVSLWKMEAATGHFFPGSDNNYSIGKAANRVVNIFTSNYVKISAKTVAALTAAATAGAGARDTVSDATVTLTAGIGAVVAGGGANTVPVFSDGTNWRIG